MMPGTDARIRTSDAADLPAVVRLLEGSGLPLAGVAESFGDFLVAEEAGGIVAAAGLERFPDGMLLRSVVVRPDRRGAGLGHALATRLLEIAAGEAQDLYLLTTSADAYFERLGFSRIAREDVPASVGGSVEFREACPASAIVMRKAHGGA